MACSLEDLQKYSALASDEIGETGANLKQVVETVNALIQDKYPNLRLPPDANQILERCLRNRKFNVDQAANQVHLYFKFLSDAYTMHKSMYFLPSVVREYFLDSLGFAMLKHRDSKGRAVFIVDFEKLPAKMFSLDKGITCWMMLMNEVTRISVETQRIGVVFACNFNGYEFGHAKHYTLSRIRLLGRAVRGAFPVRFKDFHVINCPALFTYTYAMIKPVLGEKIKNRVHFHGSDLTQFHQHLNPDILPEFMGGNLSTEECVDAEFMQQFCMKDDYYKGLFKYGYMGNKIFL